MTNYIAYMLLVKIKNSELLAQFSVDLKSSDVEFVLKSSQENVSTIKNGAQLDANLLKAISRQIYLESESEPCGLKGCKMSIFLETDKHLTEPVTSQETQSNTNYLLTQFRFDSTCSLTTFELSLFLKQHDTKASDINSTGVSASPTSSFATLTKRFLNRNNKSHSNNKNYNNSNKASTLTKNNTNQTDSDTNNSIYLDPINYNLFKCKLY